MQETIQKQTQRKAEIDSYHLLLIEVETWLRDLRLNRYVVTDDEPNTIENIQKCQQEIKELMKKEKTLTAIKAKCDNLGEHQDVKPLTTALSEQLAKTIEVIRQQLLKSNEQVHILELHLIQLREQADTPNLSEGTLDSDPMPEEPLPVEQRFEVETQTSESLQPRNVTMIESSAQTKTPKTTENISVTQTQSEGHETIKIESAPNPNVEEYTEDVLVDARYQQPNEPLRATELILRNVPQTSFETIFTEPDNTTTEVVVDAEGRKQIIVRKVIRTVQQQQVVAHTKVSSVVGMDNEPIETSETKMVHIGEPSEVITQEIIENPQFPADAQLSGTSEIHQSSVQTIVHHVTRRVIRQKKRIIRRVTIIDGKEHVTEEVIEEPEEVEITENEMPGVNINVVEMVSRTPIVEMPSDEQGAALEHQVVNEPVIISESSSSEKRNKGKQVRASKKVKQEEDTQVLDLDKAAPVDLVDNAQVIADLPVATLSHVNNVQLAVSTESQPQSATVHEEDVLEKPSFENISEIWPITQPSQSPVSHHSDTVRKSIESICSKSAGDDSIPSENIWPLDDKTGHVVDLNTYNFEKTDEIAEVNVPDAKSVESIICEEVLETKSESPKEVAPKDTDKPSVHVENVLTVEEEVIVHEKPAKEEDSEHETLIKEEDMECSETLNENIPEIVSESVEHQAEISTPVEIKERVEVEIVQPQTPIEEEKSERSERTFEIVKEVVSVETSAPVEKEEEITVKSDPKEQSDKSASTSKSEKNKKKKKKNKKGPKEVPADDTKVEISEEVVITVKTPVETVEYILPEDDIQTEAEIIVGEQTVVIEPTVEQQQAKVQIESHLITQPKPIEITPDQPEITETITLTAQVENISEKAQIDQPDEVVEIEEKPQPIADQMAVEYAVISTPGAQEPVVVVDECDSESHQSQPKEEPTNKVKSIDVRSATRLFIENELYVSDRTTRTVKLTMSPKEPSSPGSLTVKMKMDSDDQPKINVNLVEETLEVITTEPVELSVAKSTDVPMSDDDTISEKMEMPEIEATPVPKEEIGDAVTQAEQISKLTPDESYKSISELEQPVNVIEESVISNQSDSPKPLGTELIIATEVLEAHQTEDVEQQTEPTNDVVVVESTRVIEEKPTISTSMQTTPEPTKTLVDEELQTSIKDDEVVDKEIQTTPVKMASDEPDVAKTIEQTDEEVSFCECIF